MVQNLVLTTLAMTFLGSTVASADSIIYVSQNRVLDATASAFDSQGGDTESDGALAPDFGTFEEAASALVLLGGAIGSGTGIQYSTLTPTKIHADGSHSSNGEGWEEKAFGSGSGSSHFEVSFDVAQPCGYELSGFIEAFDNGGASLSLTGPSGTIHLLFPPFNDTLPISESGTLAVGTHTLVVQTSGGSSGGPFVFDYSSGAYDVDLIFDGATSVPERTASTAITASPNPFRGGTKIRYVAPIRDVVDVRIFDVRGRLVREFVNEDAERNSLEWDARDVSGAPVPAGVYFVRLEGLTGVAAEAKVVRLR